MVLFGISILMIIYGFTLFLIVPKEDSWEWGWKKNIWGVIFFIGLCIFVVIGVYRINNNNPQENWSNTYKGEYIIRHNCTLEDIPSSYKELDPKGYANFNIGMNICKIGLVIYIIVLTFGIILHFNRTKNERILDKIDDQIDALRNSNFSKDNTIKKTIELLQDAKKKIEKEEILRDAKIGIILIKKAQKRHQSEDIQRDIDELEAIYELEQKEIDIISKKYK